MSDIDPAIQALREAVRLAPDNPSLVDHLCNTLMQFGKMEDAEEEYRAGLQRLPNSETLQLGLAN